MDIRIYTPGEKIKFDPEINLDKSLHNSDLVDIYLKENCFMEDRSVFSLSEIIKRSNVLITPDKASEVLSDTDQSKYSETQKNFFDFVSSSGLYLAPDVVNGYVCEISKSYVILSNELGMIPSKGKALRDFEERFSRPKIKRSYTVSLDSIDSYVVYFSRLNNDNS